MRTLLIIHVSSDGIEKIQMPVTSLSDTVAAKELHSKCASIIQLLGQIAKGAAIPTPTLPAASVTHASNQTHHPRS
jgi:hypothetical protein